MIFDMDEGSVGFWNYTPERQNENSFLKALGILSLIIIAGIVIFFVVVAILKKRKEQKMKMEKDYLLNKIEKLQDISS